MREIKFRTWDGEKMCYANKTGIELDAYELTNVKTDKYENQVIGYSLALRLELPLMQYTGLKDKNGVEIYEGDIVSDNGYTEEVKWSSSLTGFEPFMEYDSDCSMYYEVENCEVVGNIYETPELTK